MASSTLLPPRIPIRNPNSHPSPSPLFFLESIPRVPPPSASLYFRTTRRSRIRCSAADDPSPYADDRKAEIALRGGENSKDEVELQIKCGCAYRIFRGFFDLCDEETQEAFLKTPFKHIASSSFPARDLDLYHGLLKLYDPADQTFAIGGRKLQFTVDDVVDITGLSKEGQEVSLKRHGRKKTEFRIKHFGKNRLTALTANDAILNLGAGDVNTKVQLLLLICFASFLFPFSDRCIKPALFSYVDELDALDSYAWAQAVHLDVHEGLRKVHEKINESLSVGFLNGCCSLLSVWVLQKIKLMDPIYPERFPAVRQWVFGDFPLVSRLLQIKKMTLSTIDPEIIVCKSGASSTHATMDECSEVAPIRNEGKEQKVALHYGGQQRFRGKNHNGACKKEISSLLRQIEQLEVQLVSLTESNKLLTLEIADLKKLV